ncbi:hypothetical protein H0H92_003587 [Tricholoma furcatifolium]|nr:hypothetical protein H0H92_003587 [Tricholoma furcatifolium]
MSQSITIRYELHPPAQVLSDAAAGGLTTAKTESHVVEGEIPTGGSAEGQLGVYYGALRTAIAQAKDQLGNELTAWRDAVGKAELSKETAKTLKYDADEEEEEEE